MPISDAMMARLKERYDRKHALFATECPDGVVRLPFECVSCDERRYDFSMMTGDKLPLCQGCFDGCVGAMEPCETPQ